MKEQFRVFRRALRNQMSGRDLLASLGMTCASLLFAVGCSGGPQELDDVSAPGAELTGPCEAGTSKACFVTLSKSEGTVNCYHGTQYCEGGEWSSCRDGEERTQIDPTSEAARLRFEALSLSMPGSCTHTGNECDPSCLMFDENPPDITPPIVGGGGPGTPPNWTSPPGTATCAHDLCLVDPGPLNPTCHPCVASVCATDNSCCTTDWDQACVDLVYTACAGLPVPLPPAPAPTICDYALFSEGGITAGNRLDVRGGPIFANGNVSMSADASVRVDKIIATGTVNSQNVPVGEVVVDGPNADITGSAIALKSPNTPITPLAIPTKTFSCISSWGSINTNGWSYDVTQAGTGVGSVAPFPSRRDVAWVVNNNASVVTFKEPGAYRSVDMSAGIVRFEKGGRYTFNSFTPAGGAPIIELPADGSKVFIDVCGDVTFDNGAIGRKIGTGASLDPFQLVIYTNSTGNVKVGVGANINMVVIAPHATITGQGMGGLPSRKSLFFANAFSVNTDFGVNATGMMGQACLDAGIDTSYCGGLAVWLPGNTYAVGAQAMSDGNIYSCTNAANCGLLAYEPGVGGSWAAAWTLVSACPGGGGPSGPCPVSLTIPGMTGLTTTPCFDGTDCQNNTRCTEVKTGVTCGAHSKCVTGDALANGCDECVSRICAVDPTCCATASNPGAWDQSCVDMVKTVCDAFCGVSVGGCEHDICSTGSVMTAACDSCVTDVCNMPGQGYCCGDLCAHAACSTGVALSSDCSPEVSGVCSTPGFEYCCTTNWDQDCVDQLAVVTGEAPPIGSTICDYAVLGGGLGGSGNFYGTDITGPLGWYWGTVGLYTQAGVPTTVAGSIYGGSSNIVSTTINGTGTLVSGNVTTSGSLTVAAGAMVTGTQSAWSQSAMPDWLTIPITNPATWTGPPYPGTNPAFVPIANNSASGVVPPGNYTSLTITGNATLQAGDYYVGQFTASNMPAPVTVTLPATGDVNIYAFGNFDVFANARIISPSGDPLQLQVWLDAGVAHFHPNSRMDGSVRSRTGAMQMDTGSTINGFIHSYQGTVTTQQGAKINAGGIGRMECLRRGADPVVAPPAPVCSVVTPTGYDQECVNTAATVCLTPGDDLCDYAAYGENRFDGAGPGNAVGGAVGGGKVTASNINVGSTFGDVFYERNVSVYDSTVGNIYSNGTITLNGSSTATSQTPSAGLDLPVLTAAPATCGGATLNFTTGTNYLAPGTYQNVTTYVNNTRLELAAGTYNIDSFAFNDNVDILLPPTGKVIVNVCGTLDFDANIRVALTSGSITPRDALRFQVNYLGTARAYVGGTRGFHGVITAPDAEVFTTAGALVTGMIRSMYTSLATGSIVNAAGLTGAACHQAGLSVEGPAATPLPPPPPPPPPPGSATCEYAMMGSGSLVGYANEVLGGDVGGGTGANALYLDWGVRPHFSGDFYSQGTMFLNSADVNGVAQSVGSYSAVSSTVGAGSGQVASVPNAPIPTVSFTCGRSGQGAPNANSIASGDRTLAPGNYLTVTQQGWGSRLTLQAGDYYMDSLTMEGGTQLVLPAAPGVVRIFSCGKVYFMDSTMVSGAGVLAPADAFRLQIYSSSTATDTGNVANNAIGVGTSASLYGIFRAPAGGYRQNQDSRVYGIVHAAQTAMFQRARLDATSIAGTPGCDALFPPPVVGCTATYQAESITKTTGTAAAPGWNLWANGNVSTNHNFTLATGTITVRARQDAAGLSPANMRLSIAGVVMADVPVTSTSYADYVIPFSGVTPGVRNVTIAFTNHVNLPPARNLHVDYFTTSCAAATPPSSSDPVCTAVTPSMPAPPDTGMCVDNGATFDDKVTTCTAADLAVEINCGNEITVCNHGDTNVAANAAVISFFPRAGQQFGTDNPDPSWITDTCVVNQAIPRHACVVQNCAPILALNKEFTMMINYEDVASINECSLLDNWSYFDPTFTCSGGGMPMDMVVEEDYFADCLDDSSPAWGLMAWQSQTPGNTSITFEMATATTAAGLATAPYTLVNTAKAAAPDTSDCPFSSLKPECRTDLSAKLFPMSVGTQPAYMRLRATLKVVGTDAPTLEDWKINYSCIIDQ